MKDSALTVHGSLQAERLGKYYADKGLRFTHIYSSDLQRAYKTANAILLAQGRVKNVETEKQVEVTPLVVLREQDFGFYEGKPFYARSQDSSKSGKDLHRKKHQDDPNFKDVESKEAMASRMNEFLQEHLVSILSCEDSGEEATIALVSHGIILSQLWRCFLKLFSTNSVKISPGLSVGKGGVTPLEYLGGWSNTGFLELDVVKNIPNTNLDNTVSPLLAQSDPSNTQSSDSDGRGGQRPGLAEAITAASPSLPPTAESDTSSNILSGFRMVIKTVNGKEHLTNLKRTRGVGSSKFEEGQKSIDTFFKKRKV